MVSRSVGRRVRGAAMAAVLAVLACAHAQPAAQAARSSSGWDWTPSIDWWPWRGDGRPPATGVESPHYGDSLFYFFQGRYFTSVTHLMVSQHFVRMSPHDDEAEILRGGLFLSYGLHREAGEVFATLIERGAPQPVRDRAWYYLAKIRYQRGLYAESEDALGRIEKRLPGDLEDDRTLLQANVLLARGRYVEAAKVLDTLTKGPAVSYARYNLGVALIRSGDVARGSAQLDAIGKMPAATEEFRSLRDKANVALGFAALQEGRVEQARLYLERVRLNGMFSNQALLGFGWASASQGRMKSALVPWNELAARRPGDAAVLEAKLAVPYALADLGANSQALQLYQSAIAAFDRESAELESAIAAIRSGKLLEELVARNPGDEMGWFWSIATLPGLQDLPLDTHIAHLMATHPFQEAFKNYRDLLYLSNNLQRWQENLGVLRDMLANRQRGYEERLPRVRQREDALNLPGYERQAVALQAELDRVEREADASALATSRERELQTRLARVREILERAGDDPEFALSRERHRRVAGALLWQQSEQFADRLWNARKAMQSLRHTLTQARQLDADLERAQHDEPARLDALARRIEALSARVDSMVPQIAALTLEQQGAVQELMVAELQHQKERLAEYGTQARFAVAQIVDRAASSKEGSRASAN